MRVAPSVRLHRKEWRELRALAENSAAPGRLRLRARVVLRAAEGVPNQKIAAELGTDPGTVGRWRRRFLLHGTPGVLRDAPRSGRPPSVPNSKVELVIHKALDREDPTGRRWSVRRLAEATGVSRSTVQRIVRARGAPPSRRHPVSEGGRGMGFLDQVTDMVGVYLNPPERAIAFSTDERAGAPRLGRAGLRSLDELRRRGQAEEFRAFLQVIERETPSPLDVHLLLDSRLAPAPPELTRWLTQHPRFHLHYLPSDRAGLTLVDRLVSEFSRRRVRPGESPSAQRLRHAIREHFRRGRGVPGPFVWTTSGEDIRTPSPRPGILY
ncbi:MAG TPA: helix-turn-helix domain-containing protein [Thermoplasmata archaeon]|nr:helix-turn-helix domain-containing protein [Thermoplasmata archaeon]